MDYPKKRQNFNPEQNLTPMWPANPAPSVGRHWGADKALQGTQVHHLQTFSLCQHWKKTLQAKLISKGICHIHEVAHKQFYLQHQLGAGHELLCSKPQRRELLIPVELKSYSYVTAQGDRKVSGTWTFVRSTFLSRNLWHGALWKPHRSRCTLQSMRVPREVLRLTRKCTYFN